MAEGIAYMVTGFGQTELLAVRADGRGDVTDTHVVWKTSSLVPQTPSPVLVGDLFFMINDTGTTTCLEAATGRQVWRERIRGNFAASLLYADGHIYAFSREGRTTVFKAAREYEILATNVLESGFMASRRRFGKGPLPENEGTPLPNRIGSVVPRIHPPLRGDFSQISFHWPGIGTGNWPFSSALTGTGLSAFRSSR